MYSSFDLNTFMAMLYQQFVSGVHRTPFFR